VVLQFFRRAGSEALKHSLLHIRLGMNPSQFQTGLQISCLRSQLAFQVGDLELVFHLEFITAAAFGLGFVLRQSRFGLLATVHF